MLSHSAQHLSGPLLDEGWSIFRLAVPIMFICLVNMGMSVTDTVMVSALFGAEALAAVAVGSDLYSILFYLGAGVLAGFAPLYTAAAVRGRPRRAAAARAERPHGGRPHRGVPGSPRMDRAELARPPRPRSRPAVTGPGLHARHGRDARADARRRPLPNDPDRGREAPRLPEGDPRHAAAQRGGRLPADDRRGTVPRVRAGRLRRRVARLLQRQVS